MFLVLTPFGCWDSYFAINPFWFRFVPNIIQVPGTPSWDCISYNIFTSRYNIVSEPSCRRFWPRFLWLSFIKRKNFQKPSFFWKLNFLQRKNNLFSSLIIKKAWRFWYSNCSCVVMRFSLFLTFDFLLCLNSVYMHVCVFLLVYILLELFPIYAFIDNNNSLCAVKIVLKSVL